MGLTRYEINENQFKQRRAYLIRFKFKGKMGLEECSGLCYKNRGEESKVEFVKNLLTNTDFPTAKIAMLAEVNEQLVLDIQQKLNEKK